MSRRCLSAACLSGILRLEKCFEKSSETEDFMVQVDRACLSFTQRWVLSPVSHKLDVVVHPLIPRCLEGRQKDKKLKVILGCVEFGGSLDYMQTYGHKVICI